ncbi:carbohydrate esterase family 5 protein [Bipolaris maydis ATCC 48331]|uniref:Carbohydrate esterase family 5 protein n=2 Tax=Cochliobolus heterostrophus TaxID=5016 RepID=M2UTU8_COCH5|nr:carbohydrate esterase family 5 protein [Bipolaris maydis ATCC 48331]EMD93730.1 carbohydrate esterase family 5 protein [Bipolaris maydis C5]KAJ5028016.1 carbohydrate esterase [Bipolaris maydis]EMD97001.1 carbohydrate esterase family 5 protein [Bipolaris maydis C5]ENH99306.1 carbohydrate esterase family 5 protein [Bipolaris maydis ATCC 48331]KAJ6204964.1 carbohydrate esterase family 5 protein [Bipolaris maydis]
MTSTPSLRQSLAAAVLAALPLASAQGTTPPKLTADCNNVAIFMARGNDAPYHDGRTSPFSDATCAKFKAKGFTCDYMDVVFDATLGVPYCPTIQEGAVNGVRQITEYNAKCPDTLIVLNGYSQGAMIGSATLSGGGEDACDVDPQTTGLDPNSKAGQALKAVLLWGDVKHTANQSYNVLDGADKQVWPRTGANLERMNRFSSVLRSYCAAGDPICAGGTNVAEHLNYFELYTDESSSWVVDKLTPLLTKPSSSSVLSSSATPTPTPTPSPEPTPTPTPTSAASTSEVSSTESSSTVIVPEPSIPGTSDIKSTSTAPGTTPHPITIIPTSAHYGNSTIPASSCIKTPIKPHETPSQPAEHVSYPAVPPPLPTKAPGYPAQPPACPPALVYETVTEYAYVYGSM